MAVKKKTGKKKLTTDKMFGILMSEMIAIRSELKQDIAGLGNKVDKLTIRVDGLDMHVGGLDSRIGKLETEFQSLRLGVHQNQLTFMKNHDDVEKRVTVLEAKCV